jgi:hypothetical protein
LVIIENFGNEEYIYIFLVIPMIVNSADNEIYVDQSGATANIDLEQLGSGNIIGGASAIAGTMTPLDLDGTSLTLDINQIGNSNKFLGDIYADNTQGSLSSLVIPTHLICKLTQPTLTEQTALM